MTGRVLKVRDFQKIQQNVKSLMVKASQNCCHNAIYWGYQTTQIYFLAILKSQMSQHHIWFFQRLLSLVQFSVRSILTQPFHKNKSHFRIRSTNTISLNLSHLYKVSMLKYDPILSYQELASQHKNSRRIQLSSQQIKRLSPSLSTLFGIEDDENELFLPFFRQNLKKKQLSQVKDYKQKHQYFLLLTVLCAHCIWFFLMIKLDNHVPT